SVSFCPAAHPRVLPPFPTRRSSDLGAAVRRAVRASGARPLLQRRIPGLVAAVLLHPQEGARPEMAARVQRRRGPSDLRRAAGTGDRKSTRLNSSHVKISYAVFCLKK